MKLTANGRYVVAAAIKNRDPIVQEFPIPQEATRTGRLELAWSAGDGEPGCEVAEVWLIRSGHKEPSVGESPVRRCEVFENVH